MISADPAAQAELRQAIEPHLGWLSDDARAARLVTILSTIAAPRFPGAVVPVVDREEPRLRFYAIASDPTQWRQLQPLLSAFAGRTLTDFDGRPLGNLSDSGVEKEFGKRDLIVAAFSAPPDRAVASHAVQAIARLVNLMSRTPATGRSYVRPAPELLYAFDLAIAAGNEQGATEILEELEHRQLLEVINLRFLQVRLDAEFQEWRRLRDRPWFAALCRIRRPPAVTAALIEALYWTEIAGLGDEASGLVDAFASRVLTNAGDLFRVLPERRGAATSISFLLQSLAENDVERVALLRAELTADWPEELRTRYQRLLTYTGTPEIATPPKAAEGILDRLTSAPNLSTLQLLELLVESASTGALEGQQVVHQVAALLEGRNAAQAIPVDIQVPEQPLPATWTEFFGSLSRLDHNTARRIAEQAADEWPIETQLTAPSAIAELADAVGHAVSGPQPARALAAIPHLIRWVQGDPHWPNPDLSALYDSLLATLLLSEVRRPDTFRSALGLLDALLGLGMPSADYRKMLADLRAELRLIGSTNTIDLLLDAAELTTLHPCPDEAARTSFWADELTLLKQYSAGITQVHRKVIEDLGRALGIELDLPTAPPDSLGPGTGAWRGNIGIYTLREECV